MFGMVFKSLSFFTGIRSDRYGGSTYAAAQKSKASNCSNSNNNDDENACFLLRVRSGRIRIGKKLDTVPGSYGGFWVRWRKIGAIDSFFLPLLILKVVYMDDLRIDTGSETGQHVTSWFGA